MASFRSLDVEERVQLAVARINTGDFTKIQHAADFYLIPYHRLRDRLNGRGPRKGRPGTTNKLSQEQEMAIIYHCKRMDELGVSVRLPFLATVANSMLRAAHQDPTTDPPSVSTAWPKRFVQRHPELHIRVQKPLELNRAISHEIESIRTWFSKYRSICTEFSIQPADTWNFDETGFRIGVGRSRKIVTLNPIRRAFLPSSTNRDYITAVEAVSGIGNSIASMLILKGSLFMEKWYQGLEDDVLVGLSETGYINDQLALHWIQHFEAESKKTQQGLYRLLICDGFDSHCTKEFIEFCDSHRIILYCLPPHTSHFLQPLDVNVFQPYKHWHAEAVDEAARTGCIDFNKTEFLHCFTRIKQETFKESTIRNSFRKTGLIPYDPEIVLASLREKETTREAEDPPIPIRAQAPRTPSPDLIIDPSLVDESYDSLYPPETVRAATRYVNTVRQRLQPYELSSPTQAVLDCVLSTAVTSTTSSQFAYEQLHSIKAVENARKIRNLSTRRITATGGVLKASTARYMTSQREEKELEDAQRIVNRAQRKLDEEERRVQREIEKEAEKKEKEERRIQREIDKSIRDEDRRIQQEETNLQRLARQEEASQQRQQRQLALQREKTSRRRKKVSERKKTKKVSHPPHPPARPPQTSSKPLFRLPTTSRHSGRHITHKRHYI